MSDLPQKAVEAGLSIPRCTPGIGKIVHDSTSPDLIAGVVISPLTVWPDDRGFFLEVLRVGQGIPGDFDPATTQVSAAMSYPGTKKAFHFHLHQTDFWVPVNGMFQVALVDLRRESPTFGVKNTIYAGMYRPRSVRIPPGVGHGYKVIGVDPALLVYVTDRFYDPQDEGRIAYNQEAIGYDWETQHK